jgi:hypothetical protein
MQFEWKVLSMDCYPTVGGVSNVVYNVSWKATVNDGDYTAVTTGSTDIGDASTDDFVEYDNLSEASVLRWLFDTIGTDKDQIEDSLKKSVKLLQNPPSVRLQLPWEDTAG